MLLKYQALLQVPWPALLGAVVMAVAFTETVLYFRILTLIRENNNQRKAKSYLYFIKIILNRSKVEVSTFFGVCLILLLSLVQPEESVIRTSFMDLILQFFEGCFFTLFFTIFGMRRKDPETEFYSSTISNIALLIMYVLIFIASHYLGLNHLPAILLISIMIVAKLYYIERGEVASIEVTQNFGYEKDTYLLTVISFLLPVFSEKKYFLSFSSESRILLSILIVIISSIAVAMQFWFTRGSSRGKQYIRTYLGARYDEMENEVRSIMEEHFFLRDILLIFVSIVLVHIGYMCLSG